MNFGRPAPITTASTSIGWDTFTGDLRPSNAWAHIGRVDALTWSGRPISRIFTGEDGETNCDYVEWDHRMNEVTGSEYDITPISLT